MGIFDFLKSVNKAKPANYSPLDLLAVGKVAKVGKPLVKPVASLVSKTIKYVPNLIVDAYKGLKPITKLGLIIGGTGLGISASQSSSLRTDIATSPVKAVNLFTDTGKLYEDFRTGNLTSSEKIDKIIDFGKEHKITTGLVAGGVLYTSGKVGGNIYSAYQQSKLINALGDVSDSNLQKSFTSNYEDFVKSSGTNKYDLKSVEAYYEP